MDRYDVVIVGSGFGGAIPAFRLAQAGRKVLVLERGRRSTSRDFRFSWDPRYLQTIQKFYLSADFQVAFQTGMGVGGGSVVYAGAMLRSPSEVFDFQDTDGTRLWPASMTRTTLDPYYDAVEQLMGVRQALWTEVPKAGGVFAKMLDAMGLTCDRVRFPYLSCRQCGFCEAGCHYDANRSLLFNYVPAAEQLGAAFLTGTSVTGLEPSNNGYNVHYTDAFGSARIVWGQVAVLAAGAIETPALLLRSANALGLTNPHVGQHFGNNGDVPWYWALPEGKFPSFALYKGRNNAAMITYAFWDEHRISIHTGCGPPAVFSALDVHRDAPGALSWGLEHKQLMTALYQGRLVGGIAIGLVHGEGQITIDSGGAPQISFPMTSELQAYTDRVIGVAQQIADANGAEVLRMGRDGVPLGGAHPMGTCRIGDDPARAVCDPGGQVYGVEGMFVSDASTLPGGTGVNPALTIAANAERIAAQIIART